MSRQPRTHRDWHRLVDVPNKPVVPQLQTEDKLEAGRLLDHNGRLLRIVRYKSSVPFGFQGAR